MTYPGTNLIRELSQILIGLVVGILASSQMPMISLAKAVPSVDRELVRAICGANNIVAETPRTDALAHCTTCPSFTTSGMSGGEGEAQLIAVTYGSFTGARQTEAIVDLSGCERHVTNFGGSIVLRKSSSGWEVIRYEPAHRSHTCLPLHARNQRDVLVCLGSYGQGGYFWEWLSLNQIDVTETKSTTLVEAKSNVASCNPPFFEGKILDFTLYDDNDDGWKDLTVVVSSATGVGTAQECEANFKDPTMTQLVYTFDGSMFEPTPETVQQLQYLDAIKLGDSM